MSGKPGWHHTEAAKALMSLHRRGRRPKRVPLKCGHCGADFAVAPSRAASTRHCSQKCYDSARATRPAFLCVGCGEQKTKADFFRDKSRPRGHVARCKTCRAKYQSTVVAFKVYRREGSIKNDARARGLDYDLTREQFMEFWQKPCHYCGDPIKTVGIDRLDNLKGYVVGNLVPCCGLCNRMKSAMPVEQFIGHCQKVVEMLANQSITFRGRF